VEDLALRVRSFASLRMTLEALRMTLEALRMTLEALRMTLEALRMTLEALRMARVEHPTGARFQSQCPCWLR
jgi:hypothetical protein